MHKALAITQTTFILAVLALTPASAFQCGSGAGASCSCQGRVDCKDMRRSEMCKGNLNCGNGKCTCTAALVVDSGGGGKGGIKGQILDGKPVLNAQ
jgi:hypothetical protein